MAELKNCLWCHDNKGETDLQFSVIDDDFGQYVKGSLIKFCPFCGRDLRTPKERGVDKPKITCFNCKHLMFSDMYGECNKQLRIVNPSDTCEYAEQKERGGEK